MINPNDLSVRDHLFLSYASEDWVFADWLALKLASEGYKVWYDHLKLLGGESYPRDITEAIKSQTFRVIALLSRSSISKPNPVKERTLALNIAKERAVDFLIPLNIDGLKATELDFMMSDLVYISFSESWYDGISSLLKKLSQINTPKNEGAGRQVISQWLSSEEQPTRRYETQWSNLIPVLEFPTIIKRYDVVPKIDVESIEPDWPFYRESENSLLAFSPPKKASYDWLKEVETIEYKKPDSTPIKDIKQVLTMILRTSIRRHCIRKGLIQNEETNLLFFPPDLFPNNRLTFNRYDGKRIYIQVVGQRRFRVILQGNTIIETSRYHLSPDFRFFADLLGDPVMRLRISVFWTNLEGHPLEAKTANRRRKKLCKNWWNYEWLSRIMAVMQWLGDGQDEITLIETDSGKLRIGLKPVTFYSELGIDEKTLLPIEQEDENSVIEDSEEVEEDAETDSA